MEDKGKKKKCSDHLVVAITDVMISVAHTVLLIHRILIIHSLDLHCPPLAIWSLNCSKNNLISHRFAALLITSLSARWELPLPLKVMLLMYLLFLLLWHQIRWCTLDVVELLWFFWHECISLARCGTSHLQWWWNLIIWDG